MTTIAYRNGIMAADTGCWLGASVHRWVNKLAPGPDGALHGVAGNGGECTAYLNWVLGGYQGDPPKPRRVDDQPSFVVLVAPVAGPLRMITDTGEEVYDAPYMAIGGGADTALGALFVGASARQAVQAAIEHSRYAHGAVATIFHPNIGEKQ